MQLIAILVNLCTLFLLLFKQLSFSLVENEMSVKGEWIGGWVGQTLWRNVGQNLLALYLVAIYSWPASQCVYVRVCVCNAHLVLCKIGIYLLNCSLSAVTSLSLTLSVPL